MDGSKVLEILLKKGANPNIEWGRKSSFFGYEKYPPMHEFHQYQDPRCFALLVEYGADPEKAISIDRNLPDAEAKEKLKSAAASMVIEQFWKAYKTALLSIDVVFPRDLSGYTRNIFVKKLCSHSQLLPQIFSVKTPSNQIQK